MRVAFLVTASDDETRSFMGPLATEFLIFADPDRTAVTAMGLVSLPAFVHINQHHQVEAKAEGWIPAEWKSVADNLSNRMDWTTLIIPEAGDPSTFQGTPVAG